MTDLRPAPAPASAPRVGVLRRIVGVLVGLVGALLIALQLLLLLVGRYTGNGPVGSGYRAAGYYIGVVLMLAFGALLIGAGRRLWRGRRRV